MATPCAARWYLIYSSIVVAAIVFETTWIGAAAALGTASHFNTSPAGALILTTPPAVYAHLIDRNARTGLSPVVKQSLVWGLALVLPLTLVTAGAMSHMGAHWVSGTPKDPSGLLFLGWARDVGDLRVAHFFATHAMHVIPALGLAYAWAARGENPCP